jgi:hypothetical protein
LLKLARFCGEISDGTHTKSKSTSEYCIIESWFRIGDNKLNEYSNTDIARILTNLLIGADENDAFYLGLIDRVTVAEEGAVTVYLAEDVSLFEGALHGDAL